MLPSHGVCATVWLKLLTPPLRTRSVCCTCMCISHSRVIINQAACPRRRACALHEQLRRHGAPPARGTQRLSLFLACGGRAVGSGSTRRRPPRLQRNKTTQLIREEERRALPTRSCRRQQSSLAAGRQRRQGGVAGAAAMVKLASAYATWGKRCPAGAYCSRESA